MISAALLAGILLVQSTGSPACDRAAIERAAAMRDSAVTLNAGAQELSRHLSTCPNPDARVEAAMLQAALEYNSSGHNEADLERHFLALDGILLVEPEMDDSTRIDLAGARLRYSDFSPVVLADYQRIVRRLWGDLSQTSRIEAIALIASALNRSGQFSQVLALADSTRDLRPLNEPERRDMVTALSEMGVAGLLAADSSQAQLVAFGDIVAAVRLTTDPDLNGSAESASTGGRNRRIRTDEALWSALGVTALVMADSDSFDWDKACATIAVRLHMAGRSNLVPECRLQMGWKFPHLVAGAAQGWGFFRGLAHATISVSTGRLSFGEIAPLLSLIFLRVGLLFGLVAVPVALYRFAGRNARDPEPPAETARAPLYESRLAWLSSAISAGQADSRKRLFLEAWDLEKEVRPEAKDYADAASVYRAYLHKQFSRRGLAWPRDLESLVAVIESEYAAVQSRESESDAA